LEMSVRRTQQENIMVGDDITKRLVVGRAQREILQCKY
jgi:hypothetical protein